MTKSMENVKLRYMSGNPGSAVSRYPGQQALAGEEFDRILNEHDAALWDQFVYHAQQVLAGEDTVEWARASSWRNRISLGYAIKLLDDMKDNNPYRD